jgi:hypothetical protein
MRFPKEQGFDLIAGLVITVVLEDYSLTGRFLGEFDDRHCHEHDEAPTIVNVNRETEFILLQLVCPVDVEDGPDFPIGTIIAINVDRILFIAPGGSCEIDTASTNS